MAREVTTNFKTEEYNLWLGNLKKIHNVKSDKDLAIALGMHPSSYGQSKKNDNFPFTNVIKSCIGKNISLDKVFGIKDEKVMAISDKNKIYSILNNNEYIKIPFLEQNIENSLKYYLETHTLYIINDKDTEMLAKGQFTIKKDKIFFTKTIEITLQGTYLLSGTANDIGEPVELSKEEFSKFEIIGKITNILDFKVW